MKKLSVILMLFFASNAFSQGNLQYLNVRGLTNRFPTKPLKHKYSWEKVDTEMDLWVEAIEFAVNSIDPVFFQDYSLDEKINITFFIDDRVSLKAFYMPNSWENSFVNHEGIYINLFRDVKSVKKKVDYDILEEDGVIDKTERVVLFMHELGHKTHYRSPDITGAWFGFTKDNAVIKNKENRSEDMANTFFMYALWPDHLEENHKNRHDVMDENIGDLFNFDLEMPCSIRSMLNTEYKGGEKTCGEGKIKSVLRTILFFLSASLL